MQLSHLVLTIAILGYITGPTSAEPDYCKRGMWLSDAYRHCFEQQRISLPYLPLQQVTPVIDGCMVEDYARHVCQVVKPTALSCFKDEISRCNNKDRLLSIADHSGGACYGNQVNREFKEHVLNFLRPVRADSGCFSERMGDDVYECWTNEIEIMDRDNPNLQLLTLDEFLVANNKFFDRLFTCFLGVYRSNVATCKNWQIPLLLELQGTAIPSLFGMAFTPAQMDKLELIQKRPAHHGRQLHRRQCYNQPASTSSEQAGDGQEQQQQQQLKDVPRPPYIKTKV